MYKIVLYYVQNNISQVTIESERKALYTRCKTARLMKFSQFHVNKQQHDRKTNKQSKTKKQNET